MTAAPLLLALTSAAVLWQEPAAIEAVDFTLPARGVPCATPPFAFAEEMSGGTSPKIVIHDGDGVGWTVKAGPEARSEAFVTRLVSALGYYADSVCFLAEGRIEGIRAPLGRARSFIDKDGRFTWASFERRELGASFSDGGWTWTSNPFAGTRELHGLQILVMLVSNWDNKDDRNRFKGSNLGVMEWPEQGKQFLFVSDWGQSMGSWRGLLYGHPWDCDAFRDQTSRFVAKTDPLRFGYRGQNTAGFADAISPEDVCWVLQYLGRVTRAQISMGLKASGASDHEEVCFTDALTRRIDRLKQICSSHAALP